MKVMMLGWELPPYYSGGLGIVCYQMCKELCRSGVDIEFIVPYTAEHTNIDFMKVTSATDASVTMIQKSGMAYDSFKYYYRDGGEETVDLFSQTERYVRAVDNIAQGNEYNIIHAHDWLTFRAGIRAKERTGCPLIVHVHATEFDRAGGKPGNPLVHEIEYMGLVLADRIIAISNYVKDMIVSEYDIPADKIEVVHNSIEAGPHGQLDSDNAYKYLSYMQGKNNYTVVSVIGRLTIQKGLVNFLKAAKLVVDKEPRTLFLVVGKGEQYYELIELAAELGIARNVIFTGFQIGKNLRDAFAISDLFVLPSVSEPFGITPLEAIGYGTPSLISKTSGVSEVLKNCLKVDYWDINEMANKIIAVVRDKGLRDELVTQGTKEYIKMSWNGSANKIINTYANHCPAGVCA